MDNVGGPDTLVWRQTRVSGPPATHHSLTHHSLFIMSDISRLTMTGIHKHFGSTYALRGVDLELRGGEVHALVGENGAGKSTLMKVLSGAVKPDAGRMDLDGQLYRPTGPQEARGQ